MWTESIPKNILKSKIRYQQPLLVYKSHAIPRKTHFLWTEKIYKKKFKAKMQISTTTITIHMLCDHVFDPKENAF